MKSSTHGMAFEFLPAGESFRAIDAAIRGL
jgi:hypothetical protein